MKSSFSLPVIEMYVVAGVSGSRSASMSALKTKGFSPDPFGMRNREEQQDGGRIMCRSYFIRFW